MRHGHVRAGFAVASLLLLLGPVQAAAEAVRVPGTNVSLEPPAGFAPADDFPGFQSAEQKATIMVTQMLAPAAEVM